MEICGQIGICGFDHKDVITSFLEEKSLIMFSKGDKFLTTVHYSRFINMVRVKDVLYKSTVLKTVSMKAFTRGAVYLCFG